MPELAWPWWLVALPLPWLAARLLPPWRAHGASLRLPHADLQGLFADAGVGAHRSRIQPLTALAWALLCFAAARPQTLADPTQPPRSGRDLMLAVDLSGSMGETDVELAGRTVDRLTAVKAVVGDFLQRRVGDRVGLVVFGERAYAVAPLTFDRSAVRQQLADTVVALAGRETAIGDALAIAVKRLREQPAAPSGQGQRVVILLTDGVNTAGTIAPEKAAELAGTESIRVYTIGFGGEDQTAALFGMLMPPGSASIDEHALRAIADKTGGRYFRARDTAELAGIYAELDRIEPSLQQGSVERPRVERYPLPLAMALALVLLQGLWRGGWGRA
jgi:Ca-activated chloride channel family protein